MSNVPTREDFERADKLDAERSLNLDTVSTKVTEHFRKLCRIFRVHILPQRDVNFRVYIFFYNNDDVKDCEHSGILQSIQDFIYEELERQGRGKKEDLLVSFEIDSDENVRANFEGDYLLRLR